MDKLEIANEIELKLLAYLQDFIGFRTWWDSLDSKIQGDIEEGLMVGIARHLTPDSPPTQESDPEGVKQ